MIGQIVPGIVVTHIDRYNKNKTIQPGNRE
jgi:hypothetical protein